MPAPCCPLGHRASSCLQVCDRNWDGQTGLLTVPTMTGTRTRKGWALGPEPPRTQPGTLHDRGLHHSTCPCTRMVAIVARRHNSRSATCLGWDCVFHRHQLLHASLVSFPDRMQQKPFSFPTFSPSSWPQQKEGELIAGHARPHTLIS